jgi:hypothetical protein
MPSVRLISRKDLIHKTNIIGSKSSKTAPMDKHNENEPLHNSIMESTSKPELANYTT